MATGRSAGLVLLVALLAPFVAAQSQQASPQGPPSECAVIINYGANFGYGAAQATIDVFSGSFRIFNNQTVRFCC
jgi:hypothetical protein